MKSLAHLPHPKGINPTCLVSREYTTPAGTHYRAEAYRYENKPDGEIVYTGYREEHGEWVKVPCSTRTEETRYPKRLAKLGTALVKSMMAEWP